jgi:hydroxyacylglutathione hydrolase
MTGSLPQVRLIRAPNPSPLTGAGTNTYVIGSTSLVVIDPGPDSDAHLAAILACTGPGTQIDRIVVTHAHLDHSALAPRLAARTGAEVLAYGTALDGQSPRMAALAAGLPAAGEGLDHTFRPDHRLKDGARLAGPDWELRILHTPGHLGGHICLALGDTLFSGDHVMGWATSIVAPPDGDMTDYMASLARLAGGRWHRFLPGHGDPVDDPAQRLADLVAHRRGREAAILDLLAEGPATPAGLTALIYPGLAPVLIPAAERNVLAHLIDLMAQNRVTPDPGPLALTRFRRS